MVRPNGLVFVYKLSGSGFESSCSHLNFRLRACFEQGVPWHSGNYRVWITLKRVRDMTRTHRLLLWLEIYTENILYRVLEIFVWNESKKFYSRLNNTGDLDAKWASFAKHIKKCYSIQRNKPIMDSSRKHLEDQRIGTVALEMKKKINMKYS